MTSEVFYFIAGFMAGTIFFRLLLVLAEAMSKGCTKCNQDCNQGRTCPRRMNGKD